MTFHLLKYYQNQNLKVQLCHRNNNTCDFLILTFFIHYSRFSYYYCVNVFVLTYVLNNDSK